MATEDTDTRPRITAAVRAKATQFAVTTAENVRLAVESTFPDDEAARKHATKEIRSQLAAGI